MRYLITSILLAAAFLLLAVARAQAHPEVPGKPQERPIALMGGTIHPVSGPIIEKGTLVFVDGRITAVGEDVAVPLGAEHIEISGKHVFPGLIDAGNNIGLVEIDSIRATIDTTETGTLNPNVKAQVAFNPDSEVIPVTRSNGILLSLVVPSGPLIQGQSAVMRLDGWTWEDMTQKSPAALHIRWPSTPSAGDGWAADADQGRLRDRERALRNIEEVFDHALAYRQAKDAADADSPYPHDSRWESMLPVLSQEVPVAIHTDDATSIQAAVSFAERYKLKMILMGGYDAPLVAELLKTHGIPVIVEGTHRLPQRRGDAYDDPFTVPERLRAAGVKFCIAGGGRFRTWNARNLPYEAATASAYGLPPQEALRAITFYPADILGIADQVGTLDVGKEATLIVTDGDILETATQVERAYIEGREVSLVDRHKRLWRKYEEKYERLRNEEDRATAN